LTEPQSISLAFNCRKIAISLTTGWERVKITLGMLKILDTALVLLCYGSVLVLSFIALIKTLRGTAKGYGQFAALPDKWIKWILDEKPAKKQTP
jgi:hypothetical protein